MIGVCEYRLHNLIRTDEDYLALHSLIARFALHPDCILTPKLSASEKSDTHTNILSLAHLQNTNKQIKPDLTKEYTQMAKLNKKKT